jgi:hypothetical protein
LNKPRHAALQTQRHYEDLGRSPDSCHVGGWVVAVGDDLPITKVTVDGGPIAAVIIVVTSAKGDGVVLVCHFPKFLRGCEYAE